jgi:hypothetical protein
MCVTPGSRSPWNTLNGGAGSIIVNGVGVFPDFCSANYSGTTVNGTCGLANGLNFTSEAAVSAAGLCQGNTTPTAVTTTATGWSWGCNGINGGTNTESCTATKTIAPACGTALNTCTSGTATPGSNGSWSCNGNTGTAAQCFAMNHTGWYFDLWSSCTGKNSGNTRFEISNGAPSPSGCGGDVIAKLPTTYTLSYFAAGSGSGMCSYTMTSAQVQALEGAAGQHSNFCGAGNPCPTGTLSFPYSGTCPATYVVGP